MALLERIVLASLPWVPTALMRPVARRYFAGETLGEALDELERLRARGFAGILDILGEDVTAEAEARSVADEYRRAADGLAERGLTAYVSVKPTHVGLRLRESLALELYRALASHCRDLGLFVRVEMEDHTTTDATLSVFESLRTDFDNVGIVLQSRLLRTPRDIAALAPGPLNVRMVKGVYLEPAEIAHTEPEPIRRAFVECVDELWRREAFVGLATHDDALGRTLIDGARARGLTPADYEFQVLMGVREPLWEAWLREGQAVRVYVPFGPHWRAYSTRRMRKNPELLRTLVRNAVPVLNRMGARPPA